MAWTDELLDRLASRIPCGYHNDGPDSSEPTALATIALTAAGRFAAARTALQWLAKLQANDGSVGPTATQSTPAWPTALAVLAARYLSDHAPAEAAHMSRPFNISLAVQWILATKGEPLPRNDTAGHDTTLIGWPWVNDTHSWIEPTAMHVLALKANGLGDHSRTREAVRLLIDRLLVDGGCNYGNTIVMGQTLRPHLQPTGLTMLALAGEHDADGRIKKSLAYLTRELSPKTAAASLSYGLLGLAAYDRAPRDAKSWLEIAYRRTISRDAAPYRLALLALAAMGERCPLIPNAAALTN